MDCSAATDTHEQLLEATSEDLLLLSQQMRLVPALLRPHKDGSPARPPISVLHVGRTNEQLYVHTEVLLARCPYVAAIMSSGMREALAATSHAATADFHLPDLTLRGVQSVVDFLYSGTFCVCTRSVVEIVEAAKYLLVAGVEEKCASYVAQHLDCSTALGLLETVLALQSEPLSNAVLQYVAKHAQTALQGVIMSGAYRDLALPQLLAVLARSDLEIGEDDLFRFLVGWGHAHALASPRAALGQAEPGSVMAHVSYAAMSTKTLRALLASPALPCGVERSWVREALACKEEPARLANVPPERRRRVPWPALVLHGPARFRSFHAIELQLQGGARWGGQLLDLTGADSYARVDDAKGVLNAGCSFHAEAWVCPAYMPFTRPYHGPVLSKHGCGTGWELRMGRDGVELLITLRKAQTTWHEVVACHAEVVPGKWVHVAGSFDGRSAALYVNGVRKVSRQPDWNNRHLQHSPDGATPVPADDVALTMARNMVWPDRKLVCKLTGVRVVTDRVVAPEEFLELVL